MQLDELVRDFKLNLKRTSGLTFMTLNAQTLVINDDELEELEYNLTDLLYAISMYKRGLK